MQGTHSKQAQFAENVHLDKIVEWKQTVPACRRYGQVTKNGQQTDTRFTEHLVGHFLTVFD